MSLEHWRVLQVRTPDHPPHALEGGLPADFLSHASQWIEGTDPDTGEPTTSFVGPVFVGAQIELELSCAEGASELGVIARFQHADGSVGAVGQIVSESGAYTFQEREPQLAQITIFLAPNEAGRQ